MKNIVILVSHCLSFIVRELRSNEETERNTFTGVISIFQYKRSGTYFSSSQANAKPSQSRHMCIVFTVAKLECLPIARDYSNYHRRMVAKRLRNRSKRDRQMTNRSSFSFLHRHTSDINSHESVTEAICRAQRTSWRQL